MGRALFMNQDRVVRYALSLDDDSGLPAVGERGPVEEKRERRRRARKRKQNRMKRGRR